MVSWWTEANGNGVGRTGTSLESRDGMFSLSEPELNKTRFCGSVRYSGNGATTGTEKNPKDVHVECS